MQLRLCNSINENAESQKIAYAFPELRCSFGICSIVPDTAVFKWSQIPFDVDGEVPDRLSVLEDIHLELTVDLIFGWLKM